MEPCLRVHDLGCGPRRRPRLRGVAFDLAAGERLAVLGVNGAGKSTLLQLLAGVLAPDSGEVLVHGRPLHGGEPALRRHIGYLPQRPPFYPELTLAENLAWAGRLRGLHGARLDGAVAECLALVGLEAVAGRLAGRLSGGMAQRLGLAQALIHRPDVLLLDEPTAGLDPLQAEQIRNLLDRLAGECSLVLATHLLEDVHRLCGRVIVLDGGSQRVDRAVSAGVDLLEYLRDPATTGGGGA